MWLYLKEAPTVPLTRLIFLFPKHKLEFHSIRKIRHNGLCQAEIQASELVVDFP